MKFWNTLQVCTLRILFDNNIPVPVRKSLPQPEVLTMIEMNWPPHLENGELLKAAKEAGFELLITADQNIRYQQNLAGRSLSLVVLGSNIWPIVRSHVTAISDAVARINPGSYEFIEMAVPPRNRNRR
jgi:hypothetical protein